MKYGAERVWVENATAYLAGVANDAGLIIVSLGVVLTLTPVALGYLFGRYVLKLNAAILLGAITGAMTSTPALGVVQDAAKSSVPALGYAGTYAFSNILLTLAGTAMVLI